MKTCAVAFNAKRNIRQGLNRTFIRNFHVIHAGSSFHKCQRQVTFLLKYNTAPRITVQQLLQNFQNLYFLLKILMTCVLYILYDLDFQISKIIRAMLRSSLLHSLLFFFFSKLM